MAGRGRGAVVPAWMKQREAPGSASPNLEQDAEEASENWTEHVAPDGRKYYYNATLKKSSWTKPCVVSPGASPGTDAGSAWEEHKAPDGRTYYYNRATKQSKWNLPPGAAIIPKIAARRGLEAAPSEQKLPMFVPPPGALQPGPTPHFATNAEAKEAFLKMLEVCQIPAWMSWEQVLSLLSTDRRFGGIRSVQERKAVFEEYVARKKEENKADEDARVMEVCSHEV
jgi:pre-mRNA-processing factor 40